MLNNNSFFKKNTAKNRGGYIRKVKTKKRGKKNRNFLKQKN